jgi:tetratricopeptide (TPR) repeat protein
LHKKRHGKELLESADSAFIIKEPYFTLTDDGEPTIRIDHPSDLVVVPESEAWSTNGTNGEATDDAAAAEKKARSCKDQGNAALEKQNLPLAHARYSEGLRVARQDIVYNTNPDLARDLSRNRAHVNLLLNQLDEAKADAKAALIGKEDDPRSRELDSKAFFRAGMAAYHLGDYHEAKELFEQRQKLTPDINPKETQAMLRRIQIHLDEQEAGTHDLKKLRAGLSRARPRVDAASFVGKTAVKDSPGRGRGLFATRDIPAGEIVMLTAITYDVRDDRIRVSPAGLTRAVVQKLLSNPSQIEKVMDMYGDWQGGDSNTKNVFRTDDGPVVDTFRVHDIVSRNAFGPGSQYGEKGAQDASTGLWIRAGYTNHSCLANVHKEYVGDLMVLRATQAIAAGEEIFHSYDESSDYDARQRALMHTWGFECGCALCVVEKAEDAAVREKRRELAAEADAFVQREPWANANRRVIVRAQRLARAIEETYDGEKYKGLPRLATKRIQEWLAQATARR